MHVPFNSVIETIIPLPSWLPLILFPAATDGYPFIPGLGPDPNNLTPSHVDMSWVGHHYTVPLLL